MYPIFGRMSRMYFLKYCSRLFKFISHATSIKTSVNDDIYFKSVQYQERNIIPYKNVKFKHILRQIGKFKNFHLIPQKRKKLLKDKNSQPTSILDMKNRPADSLTEGLTC